ncbi:phosphinothricin acetyltransferase [Burkholderiales bacterium]|nr:MAG: N-acetyltransferase [Burkholderiales bacterium]CAG0954305.1 phosphinothricin acetyltransferase [Burkholderiales bacterium]
MPNLLIRKAVPDDLPGIVEIYNAAIPGRLATADLEPVSLESRRAWFQEHEAATRPLWVAQTAAGLAGWLSLTSFYGRPAYRHTVEVSVYVAPTAQRLGLAAALLEHAAGEAPKLDIHTLVAYIFGHNLPSIRLFERFGFDRWGSLPRTAVLDGLERDLVIYGRRLAKASSPSPEVALPANRNQPLRLDGGPAKVDP